MSTENRIKLVTNNKKTKKQDPLDECILDPENNATNNTDHPIEKDLQIIEEVKDKNIHNVNQGSEKIYDFFEDDKIMLEDH